MAHVAKYNKSALGHMLNHYGRKEGDGVQRSNENIKKELTYLNWNAAAIMQPLFPIQFIKKRLSEVKIQNRADVNVMCDWIVTVPKDVNEADYRFFFQGVYSFLSERYGKENVISAWVHMDETTPHMHFAFIPVTVDKKKGGYKVSAKEVLTKHELQTFHSDLDKYISHYLGYSVSILNEATKEGNKTVLELQRQTAIKRKQVAEQAANAAEERLKALQGRVLTAEEVDRLNGKKTLTGAIRGITYEEYKNLKATAAKVEQSEKEKVVAEQRALAAEQVAQEIKSKATILLATAEVGAAEIIKKAKLKASRLSDSISKKERKIAELNAEKQKAEQAKAIVERKTADIEQELQERLKEISLLQSYIENLTSTVTLAKKLAEEEQKQQDLLDRDVIKKKIEIIRQKQEQRQQTLSQQTKRRGR